MLTADPKLDGRLDWNSTKAALVAQYPSPSFQHGVTAPTTDLGPHYWHKGLGLWLPVYQSGNFGFRASLGNRFKPVGNRTITFTTTPAVGDTSETLTANWSGASGRFLTTLSSGEQVLAKLTNGATTCTFLNATVPATGGSYGAAYALTKVATVTATVAGTAPIVGVANAYSVSASIGAAGSAVLGGAQTTSGVGTPDVPRNVIGAWTTSSTVTVAGADSQGLAQTETQTGTAFTGKKAFASVTGITSTAAVTGATFGTGNVLGLPFRSDSGDFFAARFNDAIDAGTFTPADTTQPATAATGDTRGTYAPAGTLDGVKVLVALFHVADNSTQVGSLGITPV